MRSEGIRLAALLAGLALLSACDGARRPEEPAAPQTAGDPAPEKIVKSDAEWRERLTPEEFRVTRQKGTEAPFTGRYWDTRTPGKYVCVCCGHVLFSSGTKFEPGCGWPSFWAPEDDENLIIQVDRSHGMVRNEVLCRHCDAHLGHVFDDGPAPTGLRYCINSASLRLVPAEDAGAK